MSEAIADFALKERPGANWLEGRFRMVPTPPLFKALRWFDELFGAAVARAHATFGADAFRCMDIPPGDIERCLGRVLGADYNPTAEAEQKGAAARRVSAALKDPRSHWLVQACAHRVPHASVIMAPAPKIDLGSPGLVVMRPSRRP
jgi:hypothetical protein